MKQLPPRPPPAEERQREEALLGTRAALRTSALRSPAILMLSTELLGKIATGEARAQQYFSRDSRKKLSPKFKRSLAADAAKLQELLLTYATTFGDEAGEFSATSLEEIHRILGKYPLQAHVLTQWAHQILSDPKSLIDMPAFTRLQQHLGKMRNLPGQKKILERLGEASSAIAALEGEEGDTVLSYLPPLLRNAQQGEKEAQQLSLQDLVQRRTLSKVFRVLSSVLWRSIFVLGMENAPALRTFEEGEVAYQAARQKYMECHLRLVISVAKGHTRRAKEHGFSFEDIVEEGNLGLLHAADRYERNRKAVFSTYAVPCIKGYISNALRDKGGSIRFPPSAQGEQRKIRTAIKRHIATHGERPSGEALERATGLTQKRILELLGWGEKWKNLTSLEQYIPDSEYDMSDARRWPRYDAYDEENPETDEGWQQLKDTVPNDTGSSVMQEVQALLRREKIDQVLQTLTYREREILKLRFGLGDGFTYTFEELGRIFKITRERVRQIDARAIRKLQHPVRARQLEGFLERGDGA